MKRPVTILHLIDSNGMYGAENVVLTLLKSLLNTHFKCILGCIRENDTKEVELGQLAGKVGLPIHYFSMSRGLSVSGILNIRKYIKEHNIPIIHSHGYKPNIYLGLMGLRKRVVITTVHGWAKSYADPKLSLYEWLNCFFIRKFDQCVAVSNGVVRDLSNKRIAPDKIVVIRNGIEICRRQKPYHKEEIKKRLGLDKNSFIVGLAGRLVKEKGIDTFIEAADLCIKSGSPDTRLQFLIAGTGPLQSQLREKIRTLGIIRQVKLIGFVPDIYEFLSILDIFVLSSNTEGLPMVLLEAMNAQVPVICSKVGGIPEVVNKENGMLVQSKDPMELSRKILFLAGTKEARLRFSQNGKLTIRDKYSAECMADGYSKLYEHLNKKNRRG